MFTPSRAESPPSELGVDIEASSDRARSLVGACDKAYSRACSMLSIHSWLEYLLPSGSLVVLFGSSKTNCLSR